MEPQKRKQYASAQLEAALLAINEGTSIYEASKTYGIPRTTLRDKRNNKYINEHCGKQTVLTKEEEKRLVDWIFYLGKSGFPVTKDQLLETVAKLVENLNRSNPFKDGVPGKGWFLKFMARHPTISRRITQNLPTSRSHITEEAVRAWFNRVHSYFEQNNLLDVLEDPNFAPQVDICLKKTLVSQTIKSGFQCCGLYPFGPDNVNYDKLLTKNANATSEESGDNADDISSHGSSTVTGNEKSVDDTEKFKQQFERRLSPEVLLMFQKSGSVWNGDETYKKLFEFWRDINPIDNTPLQQTFDNNLELGDTTLVNNIGEEETLTYEVSAIDTKSNKRVSKKITPTVAISDEFMEYQKKAEEKKAQEEEKKKIRKEKLQRNKIEREKKQADLRKAKERKNMGAVSKPTSVRKHNTSKALEIRRNTTSSSESESDSVLISRQNNYKVKTKNAIHSGYASTSARVLPNTSSSDNDELHVPKTVSYKRHIIFPSDSESDNIF
ncbi:hypothetical protein HW555_003221 [Spodoptera exigua]|uniref:HTH CENPB-type domain-containing protein n=1 Tax=Spodoptera exigua TaxID=7107 RepID=A0A835L7A8_SPOEX|nr:hypothetical protein HW555_003221 [Spodoptera exigua]